MTIFVVGERIVETELWRFGLGPDALKSGMRSRTIAQARQRIITRLREETTLSWREIGTLVGSRARAWKTRPRRK